MDPETVEIELFGSEAEVERRYSIRYLPGQALYRRDADPEIAAVGLTEAEAREEYGDDVRVGTFPFAANSRAQIYGDTTIDFRKLARARTDADLARTLLARPEIPPADDHAAIRLFHDPASQPGQVGQRHVAMRARHQQPSRR